MMKVYIGDKGRTGNNNVCSWNMANLFQLEICDL